MTFEEIFCSEIPLIDTRAPVEFAAGHFPTSVNLPLLTDEERHRVGLAYKKEGKESAIALGHSLVGGEVKAGRVRAWLEFMERNPEAQLYCFRGGLRSKISQQWIREAGKNVEMIPGGFKALRRFLVAELSKRNPHQELVLIGGKTGVGKTTFLYQQPLPFIDLERAANHRGSSFGSLGAQPAQVTFENRIAVEFIQRKKAPYILLEDEAILVGRCTIPKDFFENMRCGKLIVLERPMPARVDHIIKEYVIEAIEKHDGDLQKVLIKLEDGVTRISKKLGGLKFQEIRKKLAEAFASNEAASFAPHRAWVEELLVHYYDPLYERGIQRRENQIAFRGQAEDCIEYFRELGFSSNS